MAYSEEYVDVVGGGQLKIFDGNPILESAKVVFMLYDMKTEAWTDYSSGGPGKAL
jgi:hypothetical protein